MPNTYRKPARAYPKTTPEREILSHSEIKQLYQAAGESITGQQISTGEKVGFGIFTVLVGAAYLAAGTVAAPWIAGGALIYGVVELGSWLYNGKSIEDNILGQ